MSIEFKEEKIDKFLDNLLEEVNNHIKVEALIQRGPRICETRTSILSPLNIETSWEFKNRDELEAVLWGMIIEFVKENQVWLKKRIT